MKYINESKKTMGVKEFAEHYGIGINNAYTMVNAEGFPKIRLGRKIVIISSKIDEWIESNIGNSF
ncbi:MAG: helix-turn-helix domain-containing protein [Clostridium sp.]|jgi:predicted DNA-binding transcriptional regulator AlpA|nr:helix-turn-helix domain-containing protein [Clostridium sp.]